MLTPIDKGLGIALVAAQKASVSVTLVDTSQAALDKALAFAGKPSLCDEATGLKPV
jgi:3-hydroxyacyl-CoA dehydrogenase